MQNKNISNLVKSLFILSEAKGAITLVLVAERIKVLDVPASKWKGRFNVLLHVSPKRSDADYSAGGIALMLRDENNVFHLSNGSTNREGQAWFKDLKPGTYHAATIEHELWDRVPSELVPTEMAAAGPPLFVLDLRRAPAVGPVGAWMNAEQSMRAEGGHAKLRPARAFDAILFTETITATRPTAAARLRFEAIR